MAADSNKNTLGNEKNIKLHNIYPPDLCNHYTLITGRKETHM